MIQPGYPYNVSLTSHRRLNTLIGQISAGTTGIVFEGSAYGTSTSSFPGAFVQETNDGGGPKAYLNWLIFDKNYNLINAGWDQMTDQPKEQGQDVAHEVLMSPDLVITEPGYVYIYLSNDEETPLEVFFDDFKVEHVKSYYSCEH